MPKRFTDTAKWEKMWYRKLPPITKCFWSYLLDRCNHAGIWEVDFEFAENYIGAPLDKSAIKKTLGERVIELQDGDKWFVPDFLCFQYVTLNANNKIHNSVLAILEKESAVCHLPQGLLRVSKGLDKGLARVKDKDKEKAKDIAKAKGKDKEGKPYRKPLGLTKEAKVMLKKNGISK